ncbi:MAG: ABC transporter permease [Dehalococcoidia bacterium]|nr:ABC transporter permease [Dehalococcoidia bacterium]
MGVYIVRRLLWLPFLLLIVSFITFTLGFYGPGDPAEVRLGTRATPEAVAQQRKQMGLDRPFLVQYGDYVWRALHSDLGESYSFRGRTVWELVEPKLIVSAQLMGAALLISLLIGIPLGLLAAIKQGTWIDTALVSFALFFNALPVFLTAPFLVLVFVLRLHLFPASGWYGLFHPAIVLPLLVLSLPEVAVYVRYTRASALEVVSQDYVRTARSKGLPEFVVQTRHVLRNALIPIITTAGLSLAGLVSGAVIIELLFGIPGVGNLALTAVSQRDYPVVMGTTLMGATAFVVANLIADILYAVADPRIRYR